MLAKRNVDMGNQRSRVVCRLHNLLMELSPGGIAKELNASDAVALLDSVEPTSLVEVVRHGQALELVADIERLDDQLKVSHKRIRTAVAASNTTLTDVFGIGPILACYLIRFTGDIGRFTSRDRYAADNGTAPVERSSAPSRQRRGPSSTSSPAVRSCWVRSFPSLLVDSIAHLFWSSKVAAHAISGEGDSG